MDTHRDLSIPGTSRRCARNAPVMVTRWSFSSGFMPSHTDLIRTDEQVEHVIDDVLDGDEGDDDERATLQPPKFS